MAPSRPRQLYAELFGIIFTKDKHGFAGLTGQKCMLLPTHMMSV